jgi:hypothetical protein
LRQGGLILYDLRRIMKARKTMEHHSSRKLSPRCYKGACNHMFPASNNRRTGSKAIDMLLEKEYIKQVDGGIKDTFAYVA